MNNLYAIFDLKAEVCGPLFEARRDEQAVRTFTRLLQDPQSEVSRAPADYRLLHIGTYDREALSQPLVGLNLPKVVCEGAVILASLTARERDLQPQLPGVDAANGVQK